MQIGKKQAGYTPFWCVKTAPFQGTFYLSWTRQYTLRDPLWKTEPKSSVFMKLFFQNICINTVIVPDPKKH
jgi:hypothetical protein